VARLQGRGNVAEALRVFDEARVLLREELGTTPGPALVALNEALRAATCARSPSRCSSRRVRPSSGSRPPPQARRVLTHLRLVRAPCTGGRRRGHPRGARVQRRRRGVLRRRLRLGGRSLRRRFDARNSREAFLARWLVASWRACHTARPPMGIATDACALSESPPRKVRAGSPSRVSEEQRRMVKRLRSAQGFHHAEEFPALTAEFSPVRSVSAGTRILLRRSAQLLLMPRRTPW
jgi:hypothetical protein